MRFLLTLFLLLLVRPAEAQQLWSNHFAGLPSWKAVRFFPDPAFNTGANGPHDQHCQVVNEVNGSGANLIVLSCFSVPTPTSKGAWGSALRFVSWTGHVNPQTYFQGWEIGSEGERSLTAPFTPTRNDFYLWDGRRLKTVLYGNSMTGTFSVHDALWVEGWFDAPAGGHLGSLMVGPNWNRGYTGPTTITGGCPTRFVEGICIVGP